MAGGLVSGTGFLAGKAAPDRVWEGHGLRKAPGQGGWTGPPAEGRGSLLGRPSLPTAPPLLPRRSQAVRMQEGGEPEDTVYLLHTQAHRHTDTQTHTVKQ